MVAIHSRAEANTGCWDTMVLEDIASALEGCSIVMVVASQVGSWTGLVSLADSNQRNILVNGRCRESKRKLDDGIFRGKAKEKGRVSRG